VLRGLKPASALAGVKPANNVLQVVLCLRSSAPERRRVNLHPNMTRHFQRKMVPPKTMQVFSSK
jgi:hypothetical protein